MSIHYPNSEEGYRAESIPASPVFKFHQLLEELNSYSMLHRSRLGRGPHLQIQLCQGITESKLEAPSGDLA